MISIIVCTRDENEKIRHQTNVESTIGSEAFEYIAIDNSKNEYSISEAYNKGVKQSSGNIIVFVHDDTRFLEHGWGDVLVQKFKNLEVGLVGVAGTQCLYADNPQWISVGQPYLKGRIVQDFKFKEKILLSVFSVDKNDAEVVAVDGLFFAIRKKLFDTISFDEETFTNFHFYDLDICMQVGKTHKLIVTWDILIRHFSVGNDDEVWAKNGQKFLEKYSNLLPKYIGNEFPDPKTIRPEPTNYDITDRLS